MSMSFTGNEPDPSTAESDTLFGATPVWDRSAKKKRGFGAKPAKTVSAAPAARLAETRPTYVERAPTADQIAARELRAERLRSEPMIGTTAGVEAPLATDTTPVYATRTAAAKKSSSMAPLAVGAGILVLGGLAAAGWYATRDDGVTTLTPGATSTAALETATTPITPAPTELAANEQTVPAATQTTTTVRTEAPARRVTTTTTRTRPAPAPSAADAGVNTAATIPSAPVPYSATTGTAADTGATAPTVSPGNFVLTPAPAEPAVTPGASSATPSEPSTTPYTSAVPPTATPPVVSDPTP